MGLKPSSAPEDRSRVIVCLCLSLLALILLWERCGLVPAASGGDEVWWSDSGYFLDTEGVLRRGILADDRGSGVQSFWPPVLPVIQSFFFAAHGLSPFSMCAQSALHCTLMFLLAGVLVRQYGGTVAMSFMATIAIMAPLSVERQLTQVRMESMTAVSALAFLWLLNEGLTRQLAKQRWLLLAAAGCALSVGLLSYYPHSPFLLLGAVLILWSCRDVEAWAGVTLGALPLSVAAVMWVLSGPERFAAQILDSGGNHYFSVKNLLLLPFLDLVNLRQPTLALTAVEHLGALALGGWLVLRSRDAAERRLGMLCACLVLPVFIFQGAKAVGGTALAVVWLFGGGAAQLGQGLARAIRVLRICLPGAGFVKVALLYITAVYQAEGRDYRLVKEGLDAVDFSQGGVAMGQRAWLALRERIPADRLHFLVYSGPSLDNMPVRAKSPDALEYFSHLVLEREKISLLEEIYPWIKEGLSSGQYRKVAEIRPPFKQLPWAKEPCYDLVVYSKAVSPAARMSSGPAMTAPGSGGDR